MREPIVLSDTEWDLIVELLRVELEELPNEIHHAHTLELRQELRDRRQLVQSLLERLAVPAHS